MKHLSISCFVICLLSSNLYAQDNEMNSVEMTLSTRDPFSYEQADSMYSTAKSFSGKNYDERIDKLISTISSAINQNAMVEDSRVWNELKKLEPFRKNNKIFKSIDVWARQVANRIKKLKITNSFNELIDLSTYYKNADFNAAAGIGRTGLIENPGNLDLRNNFGLIQMHLNNDLASLLEFEIIRNIDSTYIPALINLTVVYERLGRHAEARTLSKKILALSKNNPMAMFNASWYYNLDSNLVTADTLLKRTLSLSDNSKYTNFYELNKKQLNSKKRAGKFFKIGLFQKIGMTESGAGWFWSVVLFLGACILFFVIVYKLADLFIALSYVAILAPYGYYLIFWGKPVGWAWLVVILFYIFSLIMILIKKFS